MTNVFLIDKSALARVARHASVLVAFVELDDNGVLATSPVVELEIGYSARNLADFDSVAQDRRALYQELPLTKAVTDRAMQVQRELVGRGQHRGPGVSDLLIAATAEIHGAEVVHYDRDFDTIAAYTGQPTRWIVPAGSVP
ncbi:MAG TPA: VapC toxin family PIN domain ribonuclease [Micromonosporaceae bacterium]|nr:VapC toxin family PIN domain ribonuclease [Micromonosporaceae bacterium]HCU51835.1 VapC toxin family PIN domain ribonuclease [Micromonosporaceae bacterium]